MRHGFAAPKPPPWHQQWLLCAVIYLFIYFFYGAHLIGIFEEGFFSTNICPRQLYEQFSSCHVYDARVMVIFNGLQ